MTKKAHLSRALGYLSLCAALLHGLAGIAAAQGATASGKTPDEIRRANHRRVGPVFFAPSFTISNIGVDTNVFNVLENPTSDFTASVEPKLDLWVPAARRALLTGRVTPGFTFFKSVASERSFDPGGDALGEVFFTRTRIYAGVHSVSSRQRPNFEIDARSRRVWKGVRLGVQYRVGSRLSLELGAYSETTQFDQDRTFFGVNLSQALDRNERGFRLNVRYPLTTKTTLIFRGETRRTRFDFATVKNADSVLFAPRLEFAPRALISGGLEVGIKRFRGVNPLLPNYTGLVAKANLGYTLRSATRLGVDWNRDLDYSFQTDRPYFVTNGVGGSVRRQLLKSADVIVRGSRVSYDYRRLVASSLKTGQDATSSFTIDLGYRVGRSARVGLAVSRWTRSSGSTSTNGYSGVKAGITVTYGEQ